MWVVDVMNVAKDMRSTITALTKAARELDSDAVEEIARDIESQAGSLVAAMQTDGIWVGVKIGDSGIASGQFPEVR